MAEYKLDQVVCIVMPFPRFVPEAGFKIQGIPKDTLFFNSLKVGF